MCNDVDKLHSDLTAVVARIAELEGAIKHAVSLRYEEWAGFPIRDAYQCVEDMIDVLCAVVGEIEDDDEDTDQPAPDGAE